MDIWSAAIPWLNLVFGATMVAGICWQLRSSDCRHSFSLRRIHLAFFFLGFAMIADGIAQLLLPATLHWVFRAAYIFCVGAYVTLIVLHIRDYLKLPAMATSKEIHDAIDGSQRAVRVDACAPD